MTQDVNEAIEKAAGSDDEQEVVADEPEDDGSMFDGVLDMSGSNKSLDAYEDSPYRSIAGGGDMDPEELRATGEKHVARGFDGLIGDLLGDGHPLVDLGIGFALIMFANSAEAEDEDDGL